MVRLSTSTLYESLLYYDQVVIELIEGAQLAQFVGWFDQQDRLADLLAMMDDKTITFYSYNYLLVPFRSKSGTHTTSSVMMAMTEPCFPMVHAFCDDFTKRFNYEYFLNRFRTLFPERLRVSDSSEFISGLDNAHPRPGRFT